MDVNNSETFSSRGLLMDSLSPCAVFSVLSIIPMINLPYMIGPCSDTPRTLDDWKHIQILDNFNVHYRMDEDGLQTSVTTKNKRCEIDTNNILLAAFTTLLSFFGFYQGNCMPLVQTIARRSISVLMNEMSDVDEHEFTYPEVAVPSGPKISVVPKGAPHQEQDRFKDPIINRKDGLLPGALLPPPRTLHDDIIIGDNQRRHQRPSPAYYDAPIIQDKNYLPNEQYIFLKSGPQDSSNEPLIPLLDPNTNSIVYNAGDIENLYSSDNIYHMDEVPPKGIAGDIHPVSEMDPFISIIEALSQSKEQNNKTGVNLTETGILDPQEIISIPVSFERHGGEIRRTSPGPRVLLPDMLNILYQNPYVQDVPIEKNNNFQELQGFPIPSYAYTSSQQNDTETTTVDSPETTTHMEYEEFLPLLPSVPLNTEIVFNFTNLSSEVEYNINEGSGEISTATSPIVGQETDKDDGIDGAVLVKNQNVMSIHYHNRTVPAVLLASPGMTIVHLVPIHHLLNRNDKQSSNNADPTTKAEKTGDFLAVEVGAQLLPRAANRKGDTSMLLGSVQAVDPYLDYDVPDGLEPVSEKSPKCEEGEVLFSDSQCYLVVEAAPCGPKHYLILNRGTRKANCIERIAYDSSSRLSPQLL